MNDYYEINIFDLLKTFLKKWKIILACVALFLILGILYGVVQSNKSKPVSEERVKALTAELTQEEIHEVEDAAEIINTYKEMYEKQKEYNDKSVYQKLNPYNVDTLTLTYYIDNGFVVTYPVINETNTLIPIIQTYTSIFSEDSLYDELVNNGGTGMESKYMKELISVDGSQRESGIFVIKIYADSNEMLQTIGTFVKEEISSKQEDVTALYGEHKTVLISETMNKSVDSNMAVVQSNNVERMTHLIRNITDEEALFSGDKLNYLKYLIHEEKEEKVSYLKYAVLGAALGAFLSFAFFVFKYVTDGTIKTKEEASRLLGTSYIDSVKDNASLTALKISSIAISDSFKKVAVICFDDNKYVEEMSRIIKPSSILVKDVTKDNSSYSAFSECDSAVVVIKLKAVKRKEILELKALCSDCKIKILGVVES